MNIFSWASDSYIKERNIQKQVYSGYKPDNAWESVIMQILIVFYIMDKNVVRNHGLTYFYKNILTKEKIINILDYNKDIIIEFFKNTSNIQQETIVSILIDKIKNGEIDHQYAVKRAPRDMNHPCRIYLNQLTQNN